MNRVFIDEEAYVIMRRDEYADVCQAFIKDGMERERLSRVRTDALILDVLKFYGFEDNYTPVRAESTEVERAAGIMKYDLSIVFSDNGKKARDAIAAMEG